jgi:hypothetical protein
MAVSLNYKAFRRSLRNLGQSVGSGLIGFLQAGTGAVARTAQDKMREWVSVKDYGATGDGVTDDTAAINLARDSGAAGLLFPSGTYKNTGLVFNSSDSVKDLYFMPGSQLLLVSAASRIALDIQKQVFSTHGLMEISATGTTYDGLATVGIRHGTTLQGQSYLTIERMKILDKFSSRCFVSYACVNVKIGRADIYAGSPLAGPTLTTCYGISFEPGASGCTMVECNQLYINGGLRGFNGNQLSWVNLTSVTLEYSGTAAALGVNGALHLANCANLTIVNLYGEQNQRNVVTVDSTPTYINRAMFAALVEPDSETFSALAFSDRGIAKLGNKALTIGEILPDPHVDSSVTTGLHLQGSGASQVCYLNAVQILKTRITGWTADTGTAKRTANATYVPGAALTFGAAYVEAELDAMAARMVLVEDALRDATQTIKALKDDLHGTAGHGLIGT